VKKFVKDLVVHGALGPIAGKLPLLDRAYRDKVFARHLNLFFGVYATYPEAVAAAAGRADEGGGEAVGYNGLEEAAGHEETHGFDSDEPAREALGLADEALSGLAGVTAVRQVSAFAQMVWLARLLRPGMRVVDVGGGLGLGYWLYRRYFPWPEGAKWTVQEVAATADRGQRLLARGDAAGCPIAGRDRTGLAFASSLAEAGDADILLAAGCLQYLSPDQLADFAALAGTAEAVILNKMPLTQREDYWTLQNLGATAAPYWIANEAAFLGRFAAIGLKATDAWPVPELSVDIPFAPERSVPALKGLVLARE